MGSYIFRRTVAMIFTLLIISTIIFFMFRLMPGDPTAAMVDPSIPPEAREQIIERLGLDQSYWVQYTRFMQDLVQINFGDSFYYKESAVKILSDKLGATVILMIAAMIIAYGIGVFGGAWMAWRRGSIGESFAITGALIFRSAPTFWVGIMAIYLFSVILGWLPHSGMRSSGYEADNWFETFVSLDFLKHLILPTIVAGIYFLARPLLMMRNTMLEVMREDFIEMAHAKGLKERTVLYRHAARNALLPVV